MSIRDDAEFEAMVVRTWGLRPDPDGDALLGAFGPSGMSETELAWDASTKAFAWVGTIWSSPSLLTTRLADVGPVTSLRVAAAALWYSRMFLTNRGVDRQIFRVELNPRRMHRRLRRHDAFACAHGQRALHVAEVLLYADEDYDLDEVYDMVAVMADGAGETEARQWVTATLVLLAQTVLDAATIRATWSRWRDARAVLFWCGEQARAAAIADAEDDDWDLTDEEREELIAQMIDGYDDLDDEQRALLDELLTSDDDDES